MLGCRVATHPTNDRIQEHLVTGVGVLVVEQALDVAWCQLALTAQQLAAVVSTITRPDRALRAELVVRVVRQLEM